MTDRPATAPRTEARSGEPAALTAASDTSPAPERSPDTLGHLDPMTDTPPTTPEEEELPKVAAMSIDHPRPHLLGWGEDGPPIGGRTALCDICHTLPGRPHLIVIMGVEETTRRLSDRAEGLDVERLQLAIIRVRRHLHERGMEPEITAKDADMLAAEYLASRPSDERVPEPCIECEWTEGHDPRARCGQVEP